MESNFIRTRYKQNAFTIEQVTCVRKLADVFFFHSLNNVFQQKRRVSQEALIRLLNGNANQINNKSPIEDQVEFLYPMIDAGNFQDID